MFWDGENIIQRNSSGIMKYQQKYPDVVDELEEGSPTTTANSQSSPDNCKGIELTIPENKESIYPSHMSDRDSGESFQAYHIIHHHFSTSQLIHRGMNQNQY